MSRTQKDEALDRGDPPTNLYVGFSTDPLNRTVRYWVASAFMYEMDAHADHAGDVFEYRLVRKTERGK